MKKGFLVALALVLLLAALLQLRSVQAWLLGLYLPAFPQDGVPVQTLAAQTAGEVRFATASPFDFTVILAGMHGATPTTGIGYFSLPATASAAAPVPAMVILPGSGGITAGREREYAQLLNDNGIAAFIVEYYLPRGLTPDLPYLVRTSGVTEFDVITDAYAALRLLRTSPLIDRERIGVMGFSYGGMAARFALDQRFAAALAHDEAPFALFVDFYGPCFQNLGTRVAVQAPLLTLRGTEDASNDLAACARREAELQALGVAVETQVYSGAGHAWESLAPRALKDSPYIAGCEVSYDEAGNARVNDTALATVAADAPRLEHIAARITSGGAYRDCLKHGYIVGRDETATRNGRAALLDFLWRHFARPVPVEPPAASVVLP